MKFLYILLLHSLFYSWCKFYFLSFIAPTPNFYECSSLYPLKIIFLSAGDLICATLSYSGLNLFTPLLILVHLPLIVGLQGRVIFVGVSLFPGLCGYFFFLAAPAQQHTRHGVWSDSQPAGGKEPPKVTQQQSKPNYIQWANIRGIMGIPRAWSSGDQGDCTTESQRPPTTGVHTTKTGSERGSV